jgi:putative membrane protein
LQINFLDSFLIFLRGLLMGSADIIPGVSGGTIALITGIYEHLVHSISKINFRFIKPLLKGDFSTFKSTLLDEVDFGLFIPLFLGIAVAMLTLARLVTYAMDTYTAFTFSFFLGLIVASSYILFTKISKINIMNIAIAVIGFILAYIFVSLNPIATVHTLPVIFLSGLIAICAMILPGISGSFLLLLLGQYHYMLTALQEMRLPEVITFVIGAVIGILGFSKFLDYLLETHEEKTMVFLIGVMLGTLKIPFVQITDSIALTIPNILLCVLFVIIGIVIIVVMEQKFR